MRLSILIFFLFHGTCWTSDYFCLHQPRTVHVKEGDSVTIPCTYTYPEYNRGNSRIIIHWGESDGPYCSKIRKYITDNSGNVVDEYKERISRVTHPDHQTESLIIRGLKYTDGDTFCCRATIHTTRDDSYQWSDYGTFLTFEDGRLVSQVEELMAVPGEEMVIPCHYSQETLGEAKKVTWYSGNDKQCDPNNNRFYSWDPTHPGDVYPYSLVNPPEDVSLRIHRVQGDEYRHYCCHVTTSNGTTQSRSSTELTITGPPSFSSPFSVTQPYNITGHRGESVTLSCSYTSYMESDVLKVTIYWRLGNLSGPYVYHPYKEMVNSGYRGRTGTQGAADLHIQGVKMSDDSMYYCFVMVRLCTGNGKYQKLIQYGEGTRLIVTEPSDVFENQRILMIGSISGAVLLVLLCVIFIILKTTGVMCKKKNISAEMKTSDSPDTATFTSEEKQPYCEISTKSLEHDEGATSKEGATDKGIKSQKDEENENVLYSEINQTKLHNRNPSPNQRPEEEETVYSAVRHV
ncbi:uncharacterized protein LOC130367592 isoform X1 [Hyla sarda]|uniref:uncharacterized protein LOC130367592 isoform X1 n=1 Tax=Hyla sarda TaxID=327740 RepID=UPI0024C357A2|nr:uncharacterized protein LOC130367592 isoform X1 [Hyla sarda]